MPYTTVINEIRNSQLIIRNIIYTNQIRILRLNNATEYRFNIIRNNFHLTISCVTFFCVLLYKLTCSAPFLYFSKLKYKSSAFFNIH